MTTKTTKWIIITMTNTHKKNKYLKKKQDYNLKLIKKLFVFKFNDIGVW